MNAIRGQKLSGGTFDLASQRGDASLYDCSRASDTTGFAGFLLQSAAIVGLAVGFSMLPVTIAADGHGLLAQALAEDNDGGGEDGGGEDGGGEDGGGEDGGGEDGGGEDGGGDDGSDGDDSGGEDGAEGEDGSGGEDGGEDGGEGNQAGGDDEDGEDAEDEDGEDADQESEDGEGATVIVPPPAKGW